MNQPAEQDDPKQAGQYELHGRHQQPALNELTESRNEETAERRNDIAGGTLTCAHCAEASDVRWLHNVDAASGFQVALR
jgi:hypothetical protein